MNRSWLLSNLVLAQKHNKLRHKHYLLFICQLIIDLSSIFINSANLIQVKVTKDKPINHTGPSIHYVSFLEEDKVKANSLQQELQTFLNWMGSQSLPKCSAKYIKNKGSFLLKLTWVHLIISTSTFTQADTLHNTYSITLFLLRSWRGKASKLIIRTKKKKKKSLVSK